MNRETHYTEVYRLLAIIDDLLGIRNGDAAVPKSTLAFVGFLQERPDLLINTAVALLIAERLGLVIDAIDKDVRR